MGWFEVEASAVSTKIFMESRFSGAALAYR